VLFNIRPKNCYVSGQPTLGNAYQCCPALMEEKIGTQKNFFKKTPDAFNPSQNEII
jgi:hypothetical protein